MLFSFVAPWKAMNKDASCPPGFLSMVCLTSATDGPSGGGRSSFAPFDPIENLKNFTALQLLDEVLERVRRRSKESVGLEGFLGRPASSEYPVGDVMSRLWKEVVLCFDCSSG